MTALQSERDPHSDESSAQNLSRYQLEDFLFQLRLAENKGDDVVPIAEVRKFMAALGDYMQGEGNRVAPEDIVDIVTGFFDELDDTRWSEERAKQEKDTVERELSDTKDVLEAHNNADGAPLTLGPTREVVPINPPFRSQIVRALYDAARVLDTQTAEGPLAEHVRAGAEALARVQVMGLARPIDKTD